MGHFSLKMSKERQWAVTTLKNLLKFKFENYYFDGHFFCSAFKKFNHCYGRKNCRTVVCCICVYTLTLTVQGMPTLWKEYDLNESLNIWILESPTNFPLNFPNNHFPPTTQFNFIIRFPLIAFEIITIMLIMP